MNSIVKFGTVLLVAIVAVGMTAPAAGLAGSGHAVAADDGVEIDSDLESEDGEVEIVVRLVDEDPAVVKADGPAALQDHAATTQSEIEAFAQQRDAVTIKNQFWITNAVTVEVDTNVVDVSEIAQVDHVEELHANFTVEIPEEPDVDSSFGSMSHGDTTYGLEQINAPAVWDQFGTQGDGAKVAVLDTGIDADHQDLNLYSENPDDPTYPGGWAQIDGDGDVVEDSEPHDTGSHGTHVSGTVAGGDASGTHIGVAPNVDLMHGLVLDGGSGTWAQIIGGMEWAVQNDADAISMSLGASMYAEQFVDPIQNAEAAGAVVISASGNDGEGTSGSPGNLYDGLAIGATDANEDVTGFSSGEEINTEEAWGDAAPEHWPDEYVVPDVVAPGNNVKSSVPGDSYDEFPGTSMATPHVSGVVALMVSANPDLQPEQIEQALIDSAWKPDGEPEEPDVRYGHGIVDAETAVAQVAIDTGVTGTVVSEGEPVANAEVELEGISTTTDANGDFQLIAEPGDYDLTVSGPGIEETVEPVTVEEGDDYTDIGIISADPALHGAIVEDQPGAVEAGDDVTSVVEALNAESIEFGMNGDYDQDAATLLVDGVEVEFDEEIHLGGFNGDAEIVVETAEDETGEFSLVFTATGEGDVITAETSTTTVFDELTEVGLVGHAHLDDVEETLEDELPAQYEFSGVSDADEAAEHDVLVVQSLENVDAEAFVDATDDASTGVVYLDQWGTDADGIPDFADVSDDVTDTFQSDAPVGNVEPPIHYEATDDHEILGDLSEGEEAVIHDGDFADITWFESENFDVLATANGASEAHGSGLAVQEDSATVLASSLGYTGFVNDPQYSETADQILGNSVQFVAGEEEDDKPGDSSEFNVDEIEAPPVADAGDTVQVLAAVSNDGEEAGTTDVTVQIGDADASSQELTLPANEWESLAFGAEVPSTSGVYDIVVETKDDSLTDTIEVEGEDSPDSAVLDVESTQAQAGGVATVDVSAEGDGIAGYEALIGFDPAVVQVESVSGADFDDPEVNVEDGLVKIAQAQETGEDDPALASITFDVTASEGAATELPVFGDETQLNDEQGNAFDLEIDDGGITVVDEVECGQLGDVNGDGEVTAADATLTQRHIVGLPIDGTFNEACADVTQDGEIHTGDVVAILQDVVEF